MAARLEKLLAQFGDSNVRGALINSLMSGFGSTLKEFICKSDMPDFMKEAAINEVNKFLAENRQPTTADAQAGVHECGAGELASDTGREIAVGIDAQTSTPVAGGGNNGGPRAGGAPAAGGGVDLVDGAVQSIAQQGATNQEPEEARSGNPAGNPGSASAGSGGGNWLVQLAKAMADIQLTFLNKAMENMEVMKENASAAGDVSKDPNDPAGGTQGAGAAQGGRGASGDSNTTDQGTGTGLNSDEDKAARAAFLGAQAEYQANIQMFNMMVNMTSTTLKSLGEGLTSIARKQ